MQRAFEVAIIVRGYFATDVIAFAVRIAITRRVKIFIVEIAAPVSA